MIRCMVQAKQSDVDLAELLKYNVDPALFWDCMQYIHTQMQEIPRNQNIDSI
jgi:hypothetical protein